MEGRKGKYVVSDEITFAGMEGFKKSAPKPKTVSLDKSLDDRLAELRENLRTSRTGIEPYSAYTTTYHSESVSNIAGGRPSMVVTDDPFENAEPIIEEYIYYAHLPSDVPGTTRMQRRNMENPMRNAVIISSLFDRFIESLEEEQMEATFEMLDDSPSQEHLRQLFDSVWAFRSRENEITRGESVQLSTNRAYTVHSTHIGSPDHHVVLSANRPGETNGMVITLYSYKRYIQSIGLTLETGLSTLMRITDENDIRTIFNNIWNFIYPMRSENRPGGILNYIPVNSLPDSEAHTHGGTAYVGNQE